MLTLFVLNGCGKWSVPLREHRSRVFENSVPRKTVGHGTVRSTMIRTFHQMMIELDGRSMWRIWGWGKRKVHRVLVGNIEKGEHLEKLGVDRRIILKWILNKWEGVGRINLVQDRDEWLAIVNAVTYLRVT